VAEKGTRLCLMLRIVLSGVFVATGALKVAYLLSVTGVGSSGLEFDGNSTVTRSLEWSVTCIEFIVAVLLISKLWIAGAWLALLVGASYCVYLAALGLMGTPISSCHCFGRAQIGLQAHAFIIAGIEILAIVLIRNGARQVTSVPVKQSLSS
jgi:hypothetical protein